MKKVLSLVLALVLTLCAMSFAVAEEALPEVTLFLIESEYVEYPWSFDDMPVLAKIRDYARETYGIELKVETVIATEFNNVLNTRMAAGADMPDIVRYNPDKLTAANVINFYNQGLILDLNQYAAQMPNYLAALENYPGIKSETMDAEGHLLAMSQIVVNPQHITSWITLRHDWLKALNLEAPTTPDELYTVLKAFRDNDVNGNGMADEAMMFIYFDHLNLALSPAFGVKKMQDPQTSWWADESGKVYNTMTSAEAKDYVAYVAKLFTEGLIWDQSFADSTDEMRSQFKIMDSSAGDIGAFWDAILLNTELNGYGLKSEFAPIKSLNDQILIRNYAGGGKYFITSTCPAPEKVVSFLDWFYTVEGTQVSYYGEATPGGDYYVRDTSSYDALGLTAADYELVGTDKYFEELPKETNLNRKLGANTVWPHYMPGKADQVAADFYFGYDSEVCGLSCDVEYVMTTLNWAMENGFTDIMFVAADTEQADVISAHTDLFNYMTETYKAFMSGAKSMDGWDEFVATCDSMGLADVTAVMQARYDAYMAAN